MARDAVTTLTPCCRATPRTLGIRPPSQRPPRTCASSAADTSRYLEQLLARVMGALGSAEFGQGGTRSRRLFLLQGKLIKEPAFVIEGLEVKCPVMDGHVAEVVIGTEFLLEEGGRRREVLQL